MMRVVSLEEELLDVSEYQGVPIDECYGTLRLIYAE